MANLWTVTEDNLLKLNYGRVKIDELESLLPTHTRGSIQKRAQHLKLKGNRSLAARRYEVDRKFFSSTSLLSCYWAGFIAADGCIGKDNSVRIALARKDRSHLEIFVRQTGFTGTIKDGMTNGKQRPSKPYSRIDIWGVPEWVDVLRDRYNLTPRKSLTLRPPTQLPFLDNLAFIAGYIDGDGSIGWASNRKYPIFQLGIVGTRCMLRWIYNTFHAFFPRRQWRPVKIGMTNNYPSLKFRGKRGIQICQLLKSIPKLPLLKRKWERVPCTDCVELGAI